jgi:membrane fusion protein (multidrug efflux system)
VRAVTSTKNDALLVPQRAVTQLQGGYQVAVVGSDNRVETRAIKVGEQSGSMWIVEEGLKPGETVVVQGIQRVRPSVTVNPKPAAKKD